jgi:GAF domain-containing protein
LILTYAAYVSGGVRAPAYSGHVIVVLCAGLLLGRRAALGFAGASILVGLIFLQAERLGQINFSSEFTTASSMFVAQAVYFVIAAAALYLATYSVREALTRARQQIRERQQAELALQRYAERQALLNEIGRAILTSQSPEETAQAALKRIQRLVPSQRGSISVFDFTQNESLLLAVTTSAPSQLASGQRVPIAHPERVERLRRGETFVIDDVLRLPQRSHTLEVLLAEGVRAWLFAPLQYQGELFGALNLGAAAPGAFTAEHCEIAREVADLIAVAIQQSRLFIQTSDALQREQRLNDVTRTISSALDLDTIITYVVRQAVELTGADAGDVSTLAPKGAALRMRYSFNAPPDLEALNDVPLEQRLTWEVIDGVRSVCVNDYAGHPKALPQLVDAKVRAYLGVPILAGPACWGALSLITINSAKQFSERDVQLAEALGRQAGVAIQNAGLFDATRRQVNELTVLHSIALAAARSASEDQLIGRALDIIASQLYSDVVALLLVDTAAHLLRPHPASRGIHPGLLGQTVAVGEGIIGAVAAQGQARRLTDVTQAGDYVVAIPGTRSELCVPLSLGGRVIGVINLESARPAAYSEADERLLVTIAGQLATAIERLRVEAELRRLNAELEGRVQERTAALQAANAELEAFTYSVSHDLRAPLRALDGFSHVLLENYGGGLDADGRHYLERVRQAGERMTQLIDDLLRLSRITRAELRREPVNLAALARAVTAELHSAHPGRQVEVAIADGLTASGDARLLRVALENIFSNAWKFTRQRAQARVEMGVLPGDDTPIYFVRDNGAGFNMAYADKLFGAFQRLHSAEEFPGTGVGLAITQRIIVRHGGRVWAESAVDRGTTLFFTLP